MSRYRYIALNQDGQEVEGLLEAQEKKCCIHITSKELIPISVKASRRIEVLLVYRK